MINIRCPNKSFFFVAKMLARKIAPKMFNLFKYFLSEFKKKMGLRFLKKTSTLIVFICLYLIEAGWDENLKNIWHDLTEVHA